MRLGSIIAAVALARMAIPSWFPSATIAARYNLQNLLQSCKSKWLGHYWLTPKAC